jgi:hypothetical protein
MVNEWHNLDCFKPRNYPAPIESIADNHPLYENGTKLINGKPFLRNGKTDTSRIEELTKLRFSSDYIRTLTDGAFNKYYECSKGSKCNYGSSLPYKPSYAKIGNLTELSDPDNYELKHVIEIKDNAVFFNGYFLVSAPMFHNNGKKFTGAQRASFCKAVIYSIIPGEIKRNVKNKHGNMEYMAVPDDEYLRELIAKYPPVNAPIEAIKDDLVLPDDISAYTHEALTGYPEDIFKYTPDYGVEEYDTLLINGMFDHGPSMMDNEIDTAFMDDIEKESIGEMFNAFNPVIVQKWNHRNMVIIEECFA